MGKEILNFLNETHKFSLASINDIYYLPLASANFDLFKKSLLVALDRKLISPGWYASQLEVIVSIGKVIGQWIKKIKPPR